MADVDSAAACPAASSPQERREEVDILLVEDNHADAYLLKELLAEKDSPPELHWAANGREALDFVYRREGYREAKRPDLILLDLGLPVISGYDLLKELKGQSGYADIPVFVLTTSSNPSDSDRCLSLGADGFLTKPSNLEGYRALVQKLTTPGFPKRERQAAGA
jgi:chemotaxis family two-component system response regulator Rcp1